MADVSYSILIEEKRRDDLEQLARELQVQGLRIEKTIPRMRAIHGTGDSTIEDKLRAVEGVEMVRPAHNYQLPKMDEKTPQ